MNGRVRRRRTRGASPVPDSRYYFRVRAVEIPPDFDIERHWRDVNYLISEYITPWL
jgi:hypothetical protein